MRVARLRAPGGPEQLAVEVRPLASAREAFARSLEPGRRGKVVSGVVA